MSEIVKDRNRIFVLGAGFSKPAGLPLCFELFEQVLEKARHKYGGKDGFVLDADLENYIEYQFKRKGKKISEKEVSFEDFISYLDIEHFLKLKGRDHWSDEGNVSQFIIKNSICDVLSMQESLMSQEDFRLYEEFAKNLKPRDVIITFNYDTILERTFSRMKIPYRLYPTKFDGEDDNKEVILLKMHGSIDWFDKSIYDKKKRAYRQYKPPMPVRYNVFAREYDYFPLKKIVGKHHPKESPLAKIYRASDIRYYLSTSNLSIESPLIISPSHSKMVYLNPLTEFWYGFNNFGIGHGTVIIIGFSLPEHDEYIRQPLYHLVNNFQNNDYWKGFLEKTNLKMIDYKQSPSEIKDYKKNYGFVDWSRTDCYFNGFNEESLKVIFPNS